MSSKITFEKLTPIDDVELGAYEESLDFAFDKTNKDVKNIAITGNYGSGKTSLLNTYKTRNKDKKFLHISLANFSNTEISTETNIKSTSQESDEEKNINPVIENRNDIEAKIINQLAHQIKSNKIYNSDFVLKDNASATMRIVNSVLMLLLSIIILMLVFKDDIVALLTDINLTWINNALQYTEEITLSFWIATLAIIIFLIFPFLYNKKYKKILKKINIKGYGIELFNDKNDSVFDKYLNEVIYLFENCGVQNIVFEDLDRYEVEWLFQKLREVNTLLNARIKDKEKNTFKFIYLLRDDVFNSKDRTKFFDFIIPVIPVMDSNNSYNKFIEMFGENHGFNKFFVKNVCKYIDEMRLLKNIYNEYKLYESKMASLKINLNENKLLAIIIYKNIFPHDFSILQLRKGYIYDVFQNKENILINYIEEKKKLINSYKNEISQMNNMLAESIDEVRVLCEYKSEQEGNRYRAMSQKYELLFQEKSKLLNYKNENGIEFNNKLICDLEGEIKNTSNLKLSQLFTAINENKILLINKKEENNYAEVVNSHYYSLLRYLIKNGYIDETYSNYMSFFYPNSLSYNDKAFVMSVLDEKTLGELYHLENPQQVLEEIEPKYFSKKEMLNNDLISFMLNNATKYGEQLDPLLELLRKEDWSFIMQFCLNKDFDCFVNYCNNKWDNIFECLIMSNCSDEFKLQYIASSITSTNWNASTSNNKNLIINYIKDKIEIIDYFGQRDDKSHNRIVKVLKELDVKFNKLFKDVSNVGLLRKIYENNLYVLNVENVNDILINYYNIAEELL